MAPMPIISFLNFKGGVTKTSSVVGLGAALAREGLHVLLVDTDPQGNIGVHLGISTDDVNGLQDVLGHRNRTVTEIIIERAPHLHVVPAGRSLGLARSELADRKNRDGLLAKALREVRGTYDLILIDTPPDEGLLSINAMYASQYVVFPTLLDSFSINGFNPLMAAFSEMRDAYDDKQLDILGILINRYDERLRTQNAVNFDALRDAFGESSLLFDTKVRTDEHVRKAQDAGMTIFELNPNTRAARDFVLLAHELCKRLGIRAPDVSHQDAIAS